MATSNFRIRLPPQPVAVTNSPQIEDAVPVSIVEPESDILADSCQPDTIPPQDAIIIEQFTPFVPTIMESPTPVAQKNNLIKEYNQMSMPATPTPQFNMLLEPSSGAYRSGYDGSAQHILTKMADGFMSAAQDSHSLSSEIAGATATTAATIDRGTIANRDAIERVGLSVLSATERNGSDTRLSVERTAANGMATTERNGGDTRTALYQNTQGVLASSERNGGDTRTALYQNSQGVLSAVERNGADTRASVYQGNQAVLSSSERNGGDTRTALSQAQSYLGSAVERNGGDSRQAFQQGFGQIASAVERNGGESRVAYQQGFSQLGSAVERNGGDTRASVQQGYGQVASAVERNGGDTRTAVAQSQGFLSGAVERNGGDTRAAVVDARSQVENSIGDTRSLLRGDISDTRSLLRSDIVGVGSAVALSSAATNVQVAAAARDQLLSAKDIQIMQLQAKTDLMQFNGTAFAQARSDTFQTKSELAMQLKEAELEALKTEGRLSKQMAECCCEIKEKVDARATITDVLIKDVDASRLKDDLYYAREKYLIHSHRGRDRSHSPRRGRDGRDGRDSRRRSPSPEGRRG